MAPPVVAVLNSNDDVVEMLRIVLEQAGLIAVTAHVDAIRRGEQSLIDFIKEHEPAVILYDLAPPYDRSWRFLDHVRESDVMKGRKFVITSTNAQRVREIVGDVAHVYEIVGKPYDIGEIAKAVLRALGRGDDLPPDARRV
ncbi:MAG TPA: hypothetical protein VFA59_07775 [Vicinamibacterales bacterium]|nr:hypothetical protein [Vicinamibacterales bacterium]